MNQNNLGKHRAKEFIRRTPATAMSVITHDVVDPIINNVVIPSIKRTLNGRFIIKIDVWQLGDACDDIIDMWIKRIGLVTPDMHTYVSMVQNTNKQQIILMLWNSVCISRRFSSIYAEPGPSDDDGSDYSRNSRIIITGMFARSDCDDLIRCKREYDEKHSHLITAEESSKITNATIATINDSRGYGVFKECVKRPNFMYSNQLDELHDAFRKSIRAVLTGNQYGIKSASAILLYGIPGTGKSELAKSFSAAYSQKLCAVRNNRYHGNANIIIIPPDVFLDEESSIPNVMSRNLMRAADPESITFVIFDDCDVWLGDRTELESNQGTSGFNSIKYKRVTELMSLLSKGISGLDVIFIFTTNYIDKIDPALLRSGRIDFKVEITNIDKPMAINMCNGFDSNPDEILEGESFPINPSYLQTKILNLKREDIMK